MKTYPPRSKSRNGTTLEAIVSAALAVVDEVGVEAMTIRSVAAALVKPPMSLYSHFETKEELLDLMYRDVSLRLYADSRHDSWPAELCSLCHQIRRVLLEHPRWAPLLHRPAPPMVVPLRERLLPLMALDGIGPDEALVIMCNTAMVSMGYTLVELGFRTPDGQSSLATRFEKLKAWSEQTAFGKDHPVTLAALSKLHHLDLNSNFASMVETLVAGLEARARQP